ncbi:MAG: flagellar FLiS export co-chaperone [Campylobacterales bacterium]
MQVNANESMMAIFNKHLGGLAPKEATEKPAQESKATKNDSAVFGNSKKIEAQAFSINAQNSNEAIGLLQSAKKTLGKVMNFQENMEWVAKIQQDPNISDQEKRDITAEGRNMASEMQSLLDNASFMGKKVFGSSIEIPVGSRSIEFKVEAPNLPQNLNSESIEKIFDEASSSIGQIQGAIVDITNSVSQAQQQFGGASQDFGSFSKDAFKNMF